MNNWEKVKLGEVASIEHQSVTEFDGERTYIATGDLKDTLKDISERVTFENRPSRANLITKKGDVILARMKGTNKVMIIDEVTENYIYSTGFLILRPSIKINKKFLYYFLRTEEFQREKDSYCTGATQKAINNSNFSKHLTIPLPPLSIQKEIVERLDKVDALRQKDQELVAQYDHLAQALFIDLFGDPVANEKGWERKKLGEVCSKITDGTHDTPERLKEGVKFITGKHIKPFYIDYENSDYVTEEIHNQIYKRCNPEYEDVLYTNIGVNYATAAMNIVDYEFSMKNVALLKNDRNIFRGRFLESLLNFEDYKVKLKNRLGVGGAQQFLSLKQIKDIEILLPPISLQNQFAEMIENIEAQKAKAKKQAEESENLFQALLQEAFSV